VQNWRFIASKKTLAMADADAPGTRVTVATDVDGSRTAATPAKIMVVNSSDQVSALCEIYCSFQY
jgi:hypothetical protein